MPNKAFNHQQLALLGPPLRCSFCGFTLRYRKTINATPAGQRGVSNQGKLLMELMLIAFCVLIVIFSFFVKKSSRASAGYRISGPLFSAAERSFFGVLQQALSDEYIIMGKVRVADILLPEKGLTKSEWQTAFNKISSKHFDYIICQKSDLTVLAAIELDDKSHRSKKAQIRDALLNEACGSAGFSLIRFPAKKGYEIEEVKNQVRSSLNGGFGENGSIQVA